MTTLEEIVDILAEYGAILLEEQPRKMQKSNDRIERYVELKMKMVEAQIALDHLKYSMAHPEIKAADAAYAMKYLEVWGPGSKPPEEKICFCETHWFGMDAIPCPTHGQMTGV